MPLCLHSRPPRRVPPWELPRLPGESESEHRDRRNEQYFYEQVSENQDWWKRLGERFDFRNSKVLELGCGHGALSVSIAQAGASEVLGLDIDEGVIEFASHKIRRQYPSLTSKVRLASWDIRTLPE